MNLTILCPERPVSGFQTIKLRLIDSKTKETLCPIVIKTQIFKPLITDFLQISASNRSDLSSDAFYTLCLRSIGEGSNFFFSSTPNVLEVRREREAVIPRKESIVKPQIVIRNKGQTEVECILTQCSYNFQESRLILLRIYL